MLTHPKPRGQYEQLRVLCDVLNIMCEHIFIAKCAAYGTCITIIRYMYKEYKLKWQRTIIIGNMYTICIRDKYNNLQEPCNIYKELV